MADQVALYRILAGNHWVILPDGRYRQVEAGWLTPLRPDYAKSLGAHLPAPDPENPVEGAPLKQVEYTGRTVDRDFEPSPEFPPELKAQEDDVDAEAEEFRRNAEAASAARSAPAPAPAPRPVGDFLEPETE